MSGLVESTPFSKKWEPDLVDLIPSIAQTPPKGMGRRDCASGLQHTMLFHHDGQSRLRVS